MSLLSDAMEKCTILNKTRIDDGDGGFITTYTDGVEFSGALVKDTSTQMTIAMAQGVKAAYTVTTARNVVLDFHDVFRREKDKKIFRVTSDGIDKNTPMSASLDMRQVTAEEWEIPNA